MPNDSDPGIALFTVVVATAKKNTTTIGNTRL
jgi:hypothetical protein